MRRLSSEALAKEEVYRADVKSLAAGVVFIFAPARSPDLAMSLTPPATKGLRLLAARP